MYTRGSTIENVHTSKNIDVYKGVLGVNTRKGKSIGKFVQQGFIYVHEYLCYDMCIFVNMLLYTNSFKVCTGNGRYICKFAEFEFIIYKSIYHTIYAYMRVFSCIQRGSQRERSTGDEHM